MEIFGFMQVLEGFWSQMLYFLRFWKVSDGSLWFYACFRRSLKPNVVLRKVLDGFGRFKSFQTVPELTNHSISLANRCPVNQFVAQGVQERQSFQTITFHYQINGLGSISELKAPESHQSSQTNTFHYKNDALWIISLGSKLVLSDMMIDLWRAMCRRAGAPL